MKAVLLVAAIALVAGLDQVVVQLKIAGNEQFTCKADEEVAFRISSNPTNGYAWYFVLSSAYNPYIIKTLNLNAYYSVPSTPVETSPLPVQQFQQEFRLQCISPGETGFSLIYRRPWEAQGRLKVVTLQVTV